METIPLILAILFGTAIISYVFGKISYAFKVAISILGLVAAGYLFVGLYGQSDSYTMHVIGFELVWRINPLSWLFGMIVFGLGLLVAVFSAAYMKGKERLDFYCFSVCMTIGSMFGIIVSADLLSFFFFWEIMTWSSFLMVIYYRYEAQAAGLKYFVMSLIGAYAMLIAVLMVYAHLGTLSFDALSAAWPSFGLSFRIWLLVLFAIGFGVKAAMMPLHTWAPDAYAVSPSPFSALFSGALSKMGIYGFALLLFVFGAGKVAVSVIHVQGISLPGYILAWFGAITALIGTIKAVMQDDAKKLLAYSSIGQLGYIILGFALSTSMGVTAGLFHAVNHTIFKGMLFLAIGAVFYRTGTRKLSEMGGLITRMPYTFFVVLLGIITVAGMPPLSGFVGKWLIYEALIEQKLVVLAVVAFGASTAAFLYLYRLIFTIFLGQRPARFDNVKEVPWMMRAPMLLLALLTIYLGYYPYHLLDLIGQAVAYMGIAPLDLSRSVLFNKLGNVDTMTVMNIVGTSFVIVFILFNTVYKRSRKVGLKDIHTGGEVPGDEINLHYAVDFYQPFSRGVGLFLKRSMTKIYGSLADNLEGLFDVMRFVYTGNGQTYAMFVIIALAFLFLIKEMLV